MRHPLSSCVFCVFCGYIHCIGKGTRGFSERAPVCTPNGDAGAVSCWPSSLTSHGGITRMDLITGIVGDILCLAISFSVQAAFVYWGARVVRVDCTFKEAAIIAGVCALLLLVPKVGLLLSPVAFFVLFMRLLAADVLQTVYALIAHIFLNIVLIATTH